MYSFINYLFLAVMLLAVVHFLLPRHATIRYGRGRLSLRPPLQRLMGQSTVSVVLLCGAAYVAVLFLVVHLLPVAVLAALVGGLDARTHRRVRIPQRRARRDGVAEARDDHGSVSGVYARTRLKK